jgi:uncharacterized membrane protein
MNETGFHSPSVPEDARPSRAATLRQDDVASPDTLFGLSFDSVSRAKQFLLAISNLEQDHKLRLVDAALVVKNDDQDVRVRETIDPQPARSALSGAMWTGLLGLIVGGPVGWVAGLGIGAGVGAAAAKVIDLGIPDEWVAWFTDAVRPDTATVLVLASDIDQGALGAEIERFPNVRLVHTTIRTDAFDELRSEFNDHGAPNSNGSVADK